MKKTIGTIAIALLVTACARTSPEMRIIRDSGEALGGVERIQQTKTLSIEGAGTAWNLGQNLTPDSELPAWKLTEFSRTIDLDTQRMRVKQVRTAQFLLASSSVQRTDQGVEGEIGYNVAENGMPSRTSGGVARDRRIEMLHHPIALVRAALDPAAKLGNVQTTNDYLRVEVTTAGGDVVTLDVDPMSKLPLRATSMSYNANLGDVAIETTFGDYQTVSGLKLPAHLTTKIDRYPQMELRISQNVLDGDASAAATPEEAKSMSVPPATVTVTPEEVGKGIWWLAGSGNHRSILFEFDDHLVLFEAPLNELRSQAVIDTARSLRPQKPLTHVIMSHHHFDHSGGLRVAVAEGLKIITHRSNVELFKELAGRKHSIVEDALARNPKPLQIEPVGEEMILKDRSMEVRLYHVKNNPREGTNLFAYVPRERMLIQADLYDSGWMRHPWGDNLPFNLTLHKLQVEKSVPVHGSIQTYAEVLKTIASKKGE